MHGVSLTTTLIKYWTIHPGSLFYTLTVMSQKRIGDGGSVTQKRTLATLPDTVRGTKKSSTPVSSDPTDEKGGSDKNINPSNRNLSQGKESDTVRTTTSYFDPLWNAS